MQQKVNFQAELNSIKFKIFLLLDLLSYQGQRAYSDQQVTNSWKENILILSFRSGLLLCERPTSSSRIWTRVPKSVSYDDNHYTTSISLFLFLSLFLSLSLSLSWQIWEIKRKMCTHSIYGS